MVSDAWFAFGFAVVCTVLFLAMMADKLLDLLAGLAFAASVVVVGGAVVWAFFSLFGAVHELVKPQR